MHPFVVLVIVGMSLLITVALIEDKLMPRLKDTSKFKKWWRAHVVGENFGYEDE